MDITLRLGLASTAVAVDAKSGGPPWVQSLQGQYGTSIIIFQKDILRLYVEVHVVWI